MDTGKWIGYKRSIVNKIIADNPGQKESKQPHHEVFLEDVDSFNGIFFRLQYPIHVCIRENKG